MEQSEATKALVAYARGIPGVYEDFITFISFAPQDDGADERLLEYVREHPGCNDEDILIRYSEMTILGR